VHTHACHSLQHDLCQLDHITWASTQSPLVGLLERPPSVLTMPVGTSPSPFLPQVRAVQVKLLDKYPQLVLTDAKGEPLGNGADVDVGCFIELMVVSAPHPPPPRRRWHPCCCTRVASR
jgi:hypothetical protein